MNQKSFTYIGNNESLIDWIEMCFQENRRMPFVLEAMTERIFKTKKQNNLFHKLINLFWASGCSSFNSLDDVRLHYKKVSGLIDIKYENTLKEYTKTLLRKAIILLPIDMEEKYKIVNLLKGKIEVEKSWSEVKKERAKITLDILIQDMLSANVLSSNKGKEFDDILNTIEENKNFISKAA